MRFSSTGAGVPQASCRTGWEISTSAAIGASSFTHSRKPAMISASDQTSGFGGSAGAASGLASGGGIGVLPGSGVAAEALFLSFSAASGELGCRGDGRGLVRGRRLGRLRLRCGLRLGLDRRAASWNAGSAGRLRPSGTGLAWHDLDRGGGRLCVAAAILEVASCGSRGNAARPSTAATDSLVDTETIALDRSVSILAACDMLSLGTPNGLPEYRSSNERDLWSNCDASSCTVDREWLSRAVVSA